MTCPFCKINPDRTKIVEEAEKAFVCLSNPRLMPGHLLVIPKRHAEHLSELDAQERKEIFKDLTSEEAENILLKLKH